MLASYFRTYRPSTPQYTLFEIHDLELPHLTMRSNLSSVIPLKNTTSILLLDSVLLPG